MTTKKTDQLTDKDLDQVRGGGIKQNQRIDGDFHIKDDRPTAPAFLDHEDEGMMQ